MEGPIVPAFTPATPADHPLLSQLLREFYTEGELDFTPAVQNALLELLTSPHLGLAVLIHENNRLAGYFILTFFFSLERAGKTALLDELYLRPDFRRQGLGKAALAHAQSLARAAHCKTLHLEVDPQNRPAHALYVKSGFQNQDRQFLSLPLTTSHMP